MKHYSRANRASQSEVYNLSYRSAMTSCTSVARRNYNSSLAAFIRPCVPPRVLRSYAHTRHISKSSNGEQSNRTIFSGIQPTGVPHIGNYLGALQEWVKLQDGSDPSCNLIFSIVDLHAITVQQDAEQLRKWKKETLAALLAAGLDPGRCTIFFQSDV